MFKTILVAVDGSDHSWKALDLAAEMAKNHGAKLHILHVIPYQDLPEALSEFAKAENVPIEEERYRFHYGRTLGDKLTELAEEQARNKGITSVSAQTAEGRPADAILEVAKRQAADTIVLGSRGTGYMSGMLLGSVSHRVANLADVTCIVVK